MPSHGMYPGTGQNRTGSEAHIDKSDKTCPPGTYIEDCSGGNRWEYISVILLV